MYDTRVDGARAEGSKNHNSMPDESVPLRVPPRIFVPGYWTYLVAHKFIWKTSASPQTAEESLLFGGGALGGSGGNWTEVSHRMKVMPLRFDKIEPQIWTKHCEDSSERYRTLRQKVG